MIAPRKLWQSLWPIADAATTFDYRLAATLVGPKLLRCRPDITMEPVYRFLTKMYYTNSHFVFTVSAISCADSL